MAKIFKGDVNFGFVINQTGAQPLDSRSVVQNYTEMLKAETFGTAIYNGMIVATIDEGKLYMLIDKTKATIADGWKEIGDASASDLNSIKAVVGDASNGLVKDVNDLKTTVAGIPDTYATKEDVSAAIGDIDFSTLATKSEVSTGLASKVDTSVYDEKMTQVDASIAEKADASTVYTKSEVDSSLNLKANAADVYSKTDADSTFVKSDGYVAFSQDEKTKLAGIAAGAEVNYIKSIGDNLSVDGAGKLTVTIPEVEVPFQSVAEGDKVLTLTEGVLSSTLSYAREEVEGVDSLVLKGVNGAVIGSVPVADFIADGMLESVTPVEGTNKFKFTFKKVDGSTEDFEVDFGKFVDTYHADGSTLELNSETNTFNVKAGVFDAAGAAATAEKNAKDYADGKFQIAGNYEVAGAAAAVESKLDEYKTSNDAAVDAKVDSSVYTAKVAEIDSSISTINVELAKKAVASEVNAALELKANAADVYTSTKVDELLAAKVDSSVYTAKMTEIDGSISSINTSLAAKVDAVEGSSLVSDTLITKLGNMVEIKSVSGDLTFTDGALSLDLSAYAKSADVANTYVAKEDGKGLSTNDFTDELKTKLEGVETGAEVNVVKSVDTTGVLGLDAEGKLTADLSTYATSSALTDGLATKLDASAKVNGVSFANGEATLDAGDIALEVAITSDNGEGGSVEQYPVSTSVQSVLQSLNNRITAAVSGGLTSVAAGDGIAVTAVIGNSQTVSIKKSSVENNMLELKTDGVYVQDMRSYWEEI